MPGAQRRPSPSQPHRRRPSHHPSHTPAARQSHPALAECLQQGRRQEGELASQPRLVHLPSLHCSQPSDAGETGRPPDDDAGQVTSVPGQPAGCGGTETWRSRVMGIVMLRPQRQPPRHRQHQSYQAQAGRSLADAGCCRQKRCCLACGTAAASRRRAALTPSAHGSQAKAWQHPAGRARPLKHHQRQPECVRWRRRAGCCRCWLALRLLLPR